MCTADRHLQGQFNPLDRPHCELRIIIELAVLFQVYVDAFASGVLPEVATLFDATAKLNHMTVKHASFDHYKLAMDAACGPAQPFISENALEEVCSQQRICSDSNATPLSCDRGVYDVRMLCGVMLRLIVPRLRGHAQNSGKPSNCPRKSTRWWLWVSSKT